MTETVRLVLTGHLMPDVQPEDAIQQLADVLNIALATATQLLHTAPTVIKQLEVGEQVAFWFGHPDCVWQQKCELHHNHSNRWL